MEAVRRHRKVITEQKLLTILLSRGNLRRSGFLRKITKKVFICHILANMLECLKLKTKNLMLSMFCQAPTQFLKLDFNLRKSFLQTWLGVFLEKVTKLSIYSLTENEHNLLNRHMAKLKNLGNYGALVMFQGEKNLPVVCQSTMEVNGFTILTTQLHREVMECHKIHCSSLHQP